MEPCYAFVRILKSGQLIADITPRSGTPVHRRKSWRFVQKSGQLIADTLHSYVPCFSSEVIRLCQEVWIQAPFNARHRHFKAINDPPQGLADSSLQEFVAIRSI